MDFTAMHEVENTMAGGVSRAPSTPPGAMRRQRTSQGHPRGPVPS